MACISLKAAFSAKPKHCTKSVFPKPQTPFLQEFIMNPKHLRERKVL